MPLGEARVGTLEQTHPSPFMTIGVRNAVALKPFMKSSHSLIRAKPALELLEQTHISLITAPL